MAQQVRDLLIRAAGAIAIVLASCAPLAFGDQLPPNLSITSPAPAAILPLAGATFGGSVSDVDGVLAVRVYVFDEFQGAFTVVNAAATISGSAWSFAIQPAHLSAGGFVRLWVQATDREGNVGPWELRRSAVAGGIVADAEPPLVTITQPAADPAPSTGFVFAGTISDASPISVVRVYVFDESQGVFTVANAAASVGGGSWTYLVPPAGLTPGGAVRLWVQADDAAGNTSPWQLRRTSIAGAVLVDTDPPALTITQPSASPASPSGFTFGGTVSDAGSGVAGVRVYVFDESLGSFTLSDGSATLNGGAWSFAIQPAHLSAGGFARLWVQASDAAGNTGPWQLSRVLAADVADLGPTRSSVMTTKLYVSRRNPDGTAAAPAAFTVRGVNYSPVDAGERIDTLADGRRHLRESRFAEDFPMIRELGANAIRVFSDFGTDQTATGILDEAYRNGLLVLVTLADLEPSEIAAVVNAYKRHPALLGWIIGNEWNLNRFFDPQRFPNLSDAAAAVEQAAQQAHALDPDHVVASGLGFSDDGFNLGPEIAGGALPGVLAAAPSVDIWGFNLYRGATLEPFFAEWDMLKEAGGFSGPLLITEFGTDNWDFTTARIDDALQADTDEAIWDEIHRNVSTGYAANPPSIGGFVMEWNDEWWKSGNGPEVQDAGGFPLARTIFHPLTGLPIATFQGHPDGFSNEEHFGLVDMSRQRKAAFSAMQRAFGLGTIRTDAIPLEATSVGGGPAGFQVFAKRNHPVYAGTQPGLYVGVMSLGTTTFETLRRYDTLGDPSGECRALRDDVRGLSEHDAVLAAVGGSALPDGASIADPVFAPCLEALQALGASRALELAPRRPWALIATGGLSAVNLAERLGAEGDTVRITATVLPDADEDGVPDGADPDNDNDGISDAAERSSGTDVLEPGL